MLKKSVFLVNFNKNFYLGKYLNLFFLRKSRLFIKSRYSRNRQWSKSIVYFGLWFNLFSVMWSIFFSYKYSFIFNYFFWVFMGLFLLISFKFFINSNFSRLKGVII